MYIVIVFIPLLLIITGKLFEKYPSKKANIAIGFRTSFSMKNEETWDYAQKLFPKVWIKLGAYMLIISISLLYILYNNDYDYIGRTSIVLVAIQIAFMLGSTLYVNNKLKKVFNLNKDK